ncbi:hypothetical protein [Bosea sp. (in: a-proteobacteria)]|jgi:uncharacterized coiled-coil protein SlyX|uniref:hypothetical protein n=1 Tax=Bosea sp. (in: a-proteobacteria) TaxID=1871050 RepID=UPI003566791A
MDPSSVVRVVESTGPTGAIIVAIVLGLALGAIILAKGNSLLAGGAREQQATEFQDRLIKALEALTASESSLRSQVQSLLVENAALRENLRELAASVDLLRQQMRRLIGQMRAVQEGRLPADALQLPEDAA